MLRGIGGLLLSEVKAMQIADIMREMKAFIQDNSLNRVGIVGIQRIYEEPLVGIARVTDHLFPKMKEKEAIGPHYIMPQEWLPGAVSVVSYFLPFSEQVRKANYSEGWPADEWVYARIEGELFNDALRRYLVTIIEKSGGVAMAPVLDPRFVITENQEVMTSNWSERHAAFIAGLGTFGLHKSFITEKGCAGRYGSVITNLELTATPRKYSGIYEYCIHCNLCIARCPSGAITPEGKNKAVCMNYINTQVKPKYQPRHGCGKCQTAVPCESCRP